MCAGKGGATIYLPSFLPPPLSDCSVGRWLPRPRSEGLTQLEWTQSYENDRWHNPGFPPYTFFPPHWLKSVPQFLCRAWLSRFPVDGVVSLSQAVANDRLGRKGTLHRKIYSTSGQNLDRFQEQVKCSPNTTAGNLKELIAAQTGANASKITLGKRYVEKHANVQPLPDIHRVPTHPR